MKKICKKIILIGIMLLAIPNVVIASSVYTLSKEDVDGIYYYRTGGNIHDGTGIFQKYKLDNNIVYCIEAGVPINSFEYIKSGGINDLPFDSETNKLIELIGHYGYDYSNHQTEKFQMATQALIWEAVSNSIIEYYTLPNGEGSHIDISDEIKIINDLINNHYDKPSFDNQTLNITLGDTVVLNDENNIMENFNITSPEGLSVITQNNQLIITPIKTGSYTITLTKKSYDNLTTIMYENKDPESQKMALFRSSNVVESKINVVVTAGNVKIKKLDSETNSNTPQGEGELKNAVYGIYKIDDTLITKITTNELGEASTGNILELGQYYLREISPSIGYELDENKYYFEISEDNLEITLNVYEKVINRLVEINKYYASSVTGTLNPESNIEFGVYNINNELIGKIVTDDNGYACINLVYGTYIVKQLTTSIGYEKIEDFEIIINENSQDILKYSFTNAEVTSKVKVVKKDEETGKNIISNSASFKIFNIDTNEYVCQFLNYPTQVNVCIFETDDNGEFITPLSLSSGNYYIEEISAPNGYVISSEKIYFTIDENSEFYGVGDNKYIEIIFYNKVILGEIIIYKEGEREVYADGEIKYETYVLEGVKFGLYAKEDIKTPDGSIVYYKNTLINIGITNEYGYIYFENLQLGSYYVKEISTISGLILDENEYNIELNSVNDSSEIISERLSLINEREKGTLQLLKKDSYTFGPIKDTKIEIYTIDNYLIFSGFTDENGRITIDLPTGSYYIREVIASNGYLVSDEIIFFDIVDSGEILEIEIVNEKIKIDVPNTSLYKDDKISIISGVLLFLGIGMNNCENILYVQRKKRL